MCEIKLLTISRKKYIASKQCVRCRGGEKWPAVPPEPIMNDLLPAPFRATWTRMRLLAQLRQYDLALQAIEKQRENDFEAERILHREMALIRTRLETL